MCLGLNEWAKIDLNLKDQTNLSLVTQIPEMSKHQLRGISRFIELDIQLADKIYNEWINEKIVWLDAFIANIDPYFQKHQFALVAQELWIIDNGASFYFHHNWKNFDASAKTPFAYIKDHVLLRQATKLDEADTLQNRF